MIYSKLSKLFRDVRKKHKITQTDMARKLGIYQPLLSFYENGKSNIPADLVKTIISEYKLSEQDANFLWSKRITSSNLKTIEILTNLQYSILTSQQDKDTTKQVLQLIEQEIEKLKV